MKNITTTKKGMYTFNVYYANTLKEAMVFINGIKRLGKNRYDIVTSDEMLTYYNYRSKDSETKCYPKRTGDPIEDLIQFISLNTNQTRLKVLIEDSHEKVEQDISDFERYTNTPRFESMDEINTLFSDIIEFTEIMRKLFLMMESKEFIPTELNSLYQIIDCIQKRIEFHRKLPSIWKKYPENTPEKHQDYIGVNEWNSSGQEAIHFPDQDEFWNHIKFFTRIEDIEKTCLRESEEK